MISKNEVKHIAKLARLDLSEQEIKKYQEQLEGILSYVEKLQKVDTKNIATADGGTRELENIWRDDEELKNEEINGLINMAPDVENGQVKVKKILW